MTPQLWVFPENRIFVGGGTTRTFKLSAMDDAHAWRVTGDTVTFDKPPEPGDAVRICRGTFEDDRVWVRGAGWNIGAPKPKIFTKAENVADLQRHYGEKADVLAFAS